MRELLKRIQSYAARLVLNPMVPADARATMADTSALLAELVQRVESLEEKANGSG